MIAQQKKARKPAQPWEMTTEVEGGRVTVTARRGRTEVRYAVSGIPCSFGQWAFRFTKLDPGTDPAESCYDVLVSGPDSSCDCKGFLAHGHCKHLDWALSAVEAVQMAPAPASDCPCCGDCGTLGLPEWAEMSECPVCGAK